MMVTSKAASEGAQDQSRERRSNISLGVTTWHIPAKLNAYLGDMGQVLGGLARWSLSGCPSAETLPH